MMFFLNFTLDSIIGDLFLSLKLYLKQIGVLKFLAINSPIHFIKIYKLCVGIMHFHFYIIKAKDYR